MSSIKLNPLFSKGNSKKTLTYDQDRSPTQELARSFARTKLPLTPQSVQFLATKLGYEVQSLTEKFMTLKFRSKGKPRRFGISKLIHDIQINLDVNKIKNSPDPEIEIN